MKNEEKTMYSLGDFKFTSKTNISNLSRELSSGVDFQDRIANRARAVAAKKWEETITMTGATIPAQGVGFRALVPLYNLAKAQQALTLTSGIAEHFGKFVIVSISEGRSSFAVNGEFMSQTFTITLRQVQDA